MSKLVPDSIVTATVERMAHGGEGIAIIDGQVVFVQGGFPGDEVSIQITESKKNFARGRVLEVLSPSALRSDDEVCEAAQQGAGCCDFSGLSPDAELKIKEEVLVDQLKRVGKLEEIPEITKTQLEPARGWRTRVRLGTDNQGRAGVRKLASNEIVVDATCAQAVPGLLEGIVGDNARTFSPGAEIIAVMDDNDEKHVVEVRKAPRGRRNEKISSVVEGSGEVTQRVHGVDFIFPATAFWQAHKAAPETYSNIIEQWFKDIAVEPKSDHVIAWDLYGGVGAFVPALLSVVGPTGVVHSVESSPGSAEAGAKALDAQAKGHNADSVVFHQSSVEQALDQLPIPDLIVLDPPRTGAGATVIDAIAPLMPQAVIHIGCDPATFARDVSVWKKNGYNLEKATLVNAFPGTHHFETIGLLRPESAM